MLSEGGHVIDVRPAADFAAGHIPEALSIPLREQFATWLGWLLPDTASLAFVTRLRPRPRTPRPPPARGHRLRCLPRPGHRHGLPGPHRC
ncbi:rhodanese-like domain-containing protein [Streptomyces sp. NBC_00046]|uniref:rhodanese-like domain-containing protein n=1 Tax=unclassified Streptomyces TaxID=2593676 RepID=UPI0038630165